MEQQEGNKLIAEFMELPIHDGVSIAKTPLMLYEFNYNLHSTSELKFHTSWDWLMPVVDKIEGNVDYEVDIANGICTISAPDKHQKDTFTNVIACVCFPEAKSKIEAVYKAVIEFIKWYNIEII